MENVIQFWSKMQAVEVTLSTERVKAGHSEILLGGIPMVRVEKHKHLGVILNSKSSFDSHMQAAIA